MRTFMSALHRAHWGAWASRRDLGFCSGVTCAPEHSSAEAVPLCAASFVQISAIEVHTARNRSSAAASARVRQNAACSQHSLGVAKRSMRGPSPRTGPREDAAGLERRQGSLGPAEPHQISAGRKRGSTLSRFVRQRSKTIKHDGGMPRFEPTHKQRRILERHRDLVCRTKTSASSSSHRALAAALTGDAALGIS